MSDRQKPTVMAEQCYHEAFAHFEQAVRAGWSREDLRPLFHDVDAALDDLKRLRAALGE